MMLNVLKQKNINFYSFAIFSLWDVVDFVLKIILNWGRIQKR